MDKLDDLKKIQLAYKDLSIEDIFLYEIEKKFNTNSENKNDNLDIKSKDLIDNEKDILSLFLLKDVLINNFDNEPIKYKKNLGLGIAKAIYDLAFICVKNDLKDNLIHKYISEQVMLTWSAANNFFIDSYKESLNGCELYIGMFMGEKSNLADKDKNIYEYLSISHKILSNSLLNLDTIKKNNELMNSWEYLLSKGQKIYIQDDLSNGTKNKFKGNKL